MSLPKEPLIGLEVECIIPEDTYYEHFDSDKEAEDKAESIIKNKYKNDVTIKKIIKDSSWYSDIEELPLYYFPEEIIAEYDKLVDKLESELKYKLINNFPFAKELKGMIEWGEDGSIDEEDEFKAIEFKFLIKQNNLKEDLDLIQKFLNKIRAKVNKSCGTHIHLDMRDKTKPQLARIHDNLVRSQDILYSMAHPYRRRSFYSSKNDVYKNPFKTKSKTFDRFRCDDRHSCVNSQAYDEHQTIEIRVLDGTINMDRIYNTVKVLQDICNLENRIALSSSNQVIKSKLSEESNKFIDFMVNYFKYAEMDRLDKISGEDY